MDNLPLNAIEISDVVVKRGGKIILNIPHAIIPLCGTIACIGPNGAGKTTLLKVLHGLIKPDSGIIKFLRQPNFPPIRSALVLHETPMIKCSVESNLRLAQNKQANISKDEIESTLKQIELSHLSNTPATKLSAGERQKLSLGRAILQKPNLIFLDEPTSNLDPSSTSQVELIIHNFIKNGCNVLFTSHQLSQVKRLADYILYIDNGEIKGEGEKKLFLQNYMDQSSPQFLHQEYL